MSSSTNREPSSHWDSHTGRWRCFLPSHQLNSPHPPHRLLIPALSARITPLCGHRAPRQINSPVRAAIRQEIKQDEDNQPRQSKRSTEHENTFSPNKSFNTNPVNIQKHTHSNTHMDSSIIHPSTHPAWLGLAWPGCQLSHTGKSLAAVSQFHFDTPLTVNEGWSKNRETYRERGRERNPTTIQMIYFACACCNKSS